MSKWSGKVIKGATVKLGIRHKLTHFDYLLLKKLVCGKKNWQKRERSSVWSKVTAFLDSTCSNHKSHVFPMFLPSSPHRKPQSAQQFKGFPTRLLKLDDKSPWIYIFTPTVWLVSFRCYTYRGIKRSYPPNNIIKGNPRASGVSNNPSVASAPQVLRADSGSIRWGKFPVLSLNLKHLSKFRLRVAEALQNKGLLQICRSVVLSKTPT